MPSISAIKGRRGSRNPDRENAEIERLARQQRAEKRELLSRFYGKSRQICLWASEGEETITEERLHFLLSNFRLPRDAVDHREYTVSQFGRILKRVLGRYEEDIVENFTTRELQKLYNITTDVKRQQRERERNIVDRHDDNARRRARFEMCEILRNIYRNVGEVYEYCRDEGGKVTLKNFVALFQKEFRFSDVTFLHKEFERCKSKNGDVSYSRFRMVVTRVLLMKREYILQNVEAESLRKWWRVVLSQTRKRTRKFGTTWRRRHTQPVPYLFGRKRQRLLPIASRWSRKYPLQKPPKVSSGKRKARVPQAYSDFGLEVLNQLQKRRIRAAQVKVTKIGVQMIEDEIVENLGKVDKGTLEEVSNALTSKLAGIDPSVNQIDIVGRATDHEDRKTFENDEEARVRKDSESARFRDPGLQTSSPRDPTNDARFWGDLETSEGEDEGLLVNFCYEVSGELKVKFSEEPDAVELVDSLVSGLAEIMGIPEDHVTIEMTGTIQDPFYFVLFMEEEIQSTKQEMQLLRLTEEELASEELERQKEEEQEQRAAEMEERRRQKEEERLRREEEARQRREMDEERRKEEAARKRERQEEAARRRREETERRRREQEERKKRKEEERQRREAEERERKQAEEMRRRQEREARKKAEAERLRQKELARIRREQEKERRRKEALEKRRAEDLKRKKAESARRQAEERERKEKQRVKEMLNQAKRHASAKKDETIDNVETLEECYQSLGDILEEFASNFVLNDDLLLEVPKDQVDKLRRALQPMYKLAFDKEAKKRAKRKELLDKAKAEVMKKKRAIALASANEDDCIDACEKTIDKVAKMFITKQPILKKIPREDIDDMKIELESELRDEFQLVQDERRSKIYELIDQAREKAIAQKDDIADTAHSSDDCVSSMSHMIDNFAREFCLKEPALQRVKVAEIKDIQEQELSDLKNELDPIFRDAYDEIEAFRNDKIDEIIDEVRVQMLNQKDELVRTLPSVEKLLKTLSRSVEDGVNELVSKEDKLKGFPSDQVQDLKDALAPVFREAWEDRQAYIADQLEKMLWEAEEKVMNDIRGIVAESRSEDDCVFLMEEATREFAKNFVEASDVLEEMPMDKINNLEAKMAPDFREAYNRKKAQKVEQLITETRSYVMQEKNRVIREAETPEDAEWLLKDMIIKTTENWVDKDDFLVNPPRKDVDDLIFELTPDFVNAYKKLKADKINLMMSDLRDRVMMKKREIIMDSDSAKDCLSLLGQEIDKTADFLLDREPFLTKKPSESIINLKVELESIFKNDFEEALAKKHAELTAHIKENVLEEKVNIVEKCRSEHECLSLMSENCYTHAQTFVDLDEFLKEIPRVLVKSVIEELNPIFREAYNIKRAERMAELERQAKEAARAQQEAIINASESADDAVARMQGTVDKFIVGLKTGLEPVFRDAWNKKLRTRIRDLINAARKDALATKDAIVMASSDEDDCVMRMIANVDDFAIQFVNNDDFMKRIPTEQLQDLKDELEPIFRAAYSRAHGDKLQALIDATKEAILLEKDDIILSATTDKDCVAKMADAIDVHAQDFVARDDFFRNVPQDDVDSVKVALEPMFRKHFNDKMKDKIAELLDAARIHLNQEKPHVVFKSLNENDCVQNMAVQLDNFVADYVAEDDFFKTVPDNEVEMLKIELEPPFRDAYRKARKQKVDELVDAARRHAYGVQDEIILASSNDDSCVMNMHDAVDAFAVEYCGDDEFFNGIVPGEEILELKKELEPPFRDAYLNKEAEKIKELIDAAREELERQKESIVLASNDEHDCVDNMESAVDAFVKRFVENDDFFKAIPEEPVHRLKTELDPEFRKAYNDELNSKLAELKKKTIASLMAKQDAIVLQASSEDDCVYLMKEDVDVFVREYVKKDNFFKEIPTGVIPDIQDELEPIFREAYKDKERDKKAELEGACERSLMNILPDIVLESLDLPDCLARMEDSVESFVDDFVEVDPFFKHVPHDVVEMLQRKLKGPFEEAFQRSTDDKLSQLYVAAKAKILSLKDSIVLDALDLPDCLNRMHDELAEFVDDFIKNDDFLKSVPKETVRKLKEELDPIFEDAYNQKQSEKEKELYKQVKQDVLTQKDDIVTESTDVGDCIGRMHSACDNAAKAFVNNDDFLKSIPRDVVKRVKDELEPIFENAYNDREDDKMRELIAQTKKAILANKDDIVCASSGTDDCVINMHGDIDAFVADFVQGDDFLKSVPVDTVDSIKGDLEPTFRNAYEKKHKEKLKALLDAAKNDALAKEDQLILDAEDAEDCILRMNIAVDEFVKDFVDADDFLKIVPVEEVDDLKTRTLEPIFRDDYAKMEASKIAELLAAAKRHALANKDKIVLASWGPEDCTGRLEDSLDSFASDFVLKDDFFKEVPEEPIHKLQQQLEPIFKEAYNRKLLEKIKELISAARKHTIGAKDQIVLKSRSEDDCAQNMFSEVDAFCSNYVASDDFLKELPEKEVSQLKNQLEPTFRIAFKDRMKAKIAELMDATKRSTLANKDSIVKSAESEDDCVKKMHIYVDTYAQEFVDRDDFLKEVPQKEVDALKKKLEASFRDAYRQAYKNKLQDFEDYVKEKVYDDKHQIVMQSLDPNDCIRRMQKAVDENADVFVASDDFLKRVPEKEVAQIKKDLEDPFRQAYESKDNEKLQDLLTSARDHALDGKDSILLDAKDADDCLKRMEHLVDDFANKFVRSDDFFKGKLPRAAVDSLKRELKPLFRDAFKNAEENHIAELLKSVRRAMMKDLPQIILEAVDLPDCIDLMNDGITNNSKKFISKVPFFKTFPKEAIDELRRELEPVFTDAYRKKQKEKIRELVSACREHAEDKMDSIVLDSIDENDCVARMEGSIQTFAQKAVRADDFFKNLPSDEILQVMAEMEPNYRRSYKMMQKDRTAQLLGFVKSSTLREKKDIVLKSVSSDDCNLGMREIVDVYARSFVEDDDFFKAVPKEPISNLKDELENEFRDAYDAMLSDRIAKLVTADEKYVLGQRTKIVFSASNLRDVQKRMEAAIEKFALDYVKNDDFLNEVPEEEISKLKRKLWPIFQAFYEQTREENVGAMIDSARANTLDSLEKICQDAIDVNDCIDLMGQNVDDFIDSFIDNCSFNLKKPEEDIAQLKDELTPIFVEAFGTRLDEKAEELIDATREAVADRLKEILYASTSPKDCIRRMQNSVDAFAEDFVESDPWLKSIPSDRLQEVKGELEPVFRKTYDDLHKDKVRQMIDQVKSQVLNEKEDIVNASESAHDCLGRMHGLVDEIANDFIENDDFLKELPEEEIERLKKKLDPHFRDAYEDRIAAEELDRERRKKIQSLIEDARTVMDMQRTGIVNEANSMQACVDLMSRTLLDFAREFVNEERLLDEIPVQEIKALRDEIQPIYMQEFEKKRQREEREALIKRKIREMLEGAKNEALRRAEEIIQKSESEAEMLQKMRMLVDHHCNEFVANDDILDKVPKAPVEKLKTDLDAYFTKEWLAEQRRLQMLQKLTHSRREAELISRARQEALDKMFDIVETSSDVDECLQRMRDFVDTFAENFVADPDEFLKKVPHEKINHLKEQLEPEFIAAMEERLEQIRWEEENRAEREKELMRLNEILSIKTKLMFPNPSYITVPMRRGGTIHQLKQYMIDIYGYDEEDPMTVKIGKVRLHWEDVVDDLDINPKKTEFKLWLPEAKGRQKVFKRLDIQKQRVLHKNDFPRALESIGISIGAGALEKVWRLLDCENKRLISYKQFQCIISPEAHIREFTKVIPLLAQIPDDEYRAFSRAKLAVRIDYIKAITQIVSNDARLKRFNDAKDIFSLFGSFDSYMEGRISLPLFRTGLEIAGLILNEVHIHILFHRMTGNYNRKYLTIDDFLALHPEQDCTIDQFLHAVNGLFDDLTENDYHKMKKRIYRSAKQEQLAISQYEKSKRTPREVLGVR